MGEALANVAVAAGIALAGIALLLCLIGVASYLRLRHARLLGAAIALGFLAIQGALLTQEAYDERAAIAAGEAAFPWAIAAGLGAAGALYVSVLKR